MLKNRVALILLAPLALAACQKTGPDSSATTSASEAETAQSTPQADAAPGGRLVLAVIAGRPSAAYIAWRNTGTAPVTITGVEIEGAQKAEMHETRGGAMVPLPKVALAPGEEAHFMPGGRHVMVFGLPVKVKVGDKLPYTLLLADGGKLAGTLSVEEAGAGHDMGDMKM
jgi:copper(I)-binding protein